jgi:sugar lactone lactonase YvrE
MRNSVLKHILAGCWLIIAQAALAQDKITFSGARSIAVDSKDNVFVGVRDQLIRIAPDGKATLFLDGWKNFIKNLTVAIDYQTIDAQDNLYVIKSRDNLIRKIAPNGKVSLLAGQPYTYGVIDGPLATANFRSLDHIAMDRAGNLYVLDADEKTENTNLTYRNYLLRRISKDGTVTTIKDAATKEKIWFKRCEGLATDAAGNVYVSDSDDRCIKKIALTGKETGTLTVVAGMCGKREFHPVYTPGDVATAELFTPGPIAFAKNGDLMFADVRLHKIIKIANNKISTVAGNSVIQKGVNMGGRATEGYLDGPAAKAMFNFPLGVALAYDSKGNLYIVDGGNGCIRKLSSDGIVSTFIK